MYLKASIKIKKLAITQVAVSSRSCALTALKPVSPAALKKRSDADISKDFGFSKPPNF